MTDGLAIRITITLLTACQAGISALLAFADILPQWAKISMVVASAMLAVVLNQVPSWANAGNAARAARASAATRVD